MNAFKTTPLAELRQKLDDAKARLSVAVSEMQPLQDEVNKLQEAISDALSDTAATLFANEGKNAGDITINIDGAGKFKASISKSVKWDSAKLQNIAASMPWNEAVGLFKIDFSVPEANFKAAQSMKPELAEKLIEARTVKYGDLKIVAVD